MKRSEMLDKLVFSIELHAGNDPGWLDHDAKLKERAYEHAHRVLQDLEEAGMKPSKYVHPSAIEDFGDIIKSRGEHWGYIHYIDKYPEHHFIKGRPYEYYLEGWEPEDE